MRIEQIEAQVWHCGQLSRTLRAEHRAVLDHMQAPTHRELRDTFEDSCFRRSWLLDGKLAAMAGVKGPLATSDGGLWMVITDEMAKHPFAICKHALRYLDEVMRLKTYLGTGVFSDDRGGVAFAYFLGFMVDGREPVNGVPAMQMSYSARKAA